ncbi:MAG TPA: phosphomannomutase/phosphoglucomutase [Rhodospirillaceae bacterium]|nr:phosphomannomutase/phosphoglucomutase [Rhodospirillaceae bacterium]
MTTGVKARLHPTIFREYDIRGIVGETLFAEDAHALGQAFASRVGPGGRVAVGYDGRLSSPQLSSALMAGLVAGGAQVVDIGRGPTPMLYFASHHLATDGAMMVTGSHNPPSHNGLKMMLRGKPFFGPDIKDLGVRAAAAATAGQAGGRESRDVSAAYLAKLLTEAPAGRPLTVVWDPGNGATGDIVTRLTAALPGRHVLINETIDGHFPAHHPDPTDPHTLEQLIARVAAEGADLGIAFDGDGDRIGVIDGKGRILWGDQILMLLAEEVLANQPGAPIMADVKASKALFDRIAQLGGKPVMWKTGHSLIKTRMAELKVPLAGEMSGHIFFADRYFGFDDAIYAAIRLLRLVAGWQGVSLADRYDGLPRLLNTPELRFDCADEVKFKVVAEVRDRLKGGPGAVDDLDGVRVTHADGWWLLRSSNTQAVLVARAEGEDEAALGRMKAELAQHLKAAGVPVPPGIL